MTSEAPGRVDHRITVRELLLREGWEPGEASHCTPESVASVLGPAAVGITNGFFREYRVDLRKPALDAHEPFIELFTHGTPECPQLIGQVALHAPLAGPKLAALLESTSDAASRAAMAAREELWGYRFVAYEKIEDDACIERKYVQELSGEDYYHPHPSTWETGPVEMIMFDEPGSREC